jgi:hypothetical protein
LEDSISTAAYVSLTGNENYPEHFMYIVPIAWLYVVVMMSVAEATNANGTLLGALITLVLYGLFPVGLILYFLGAPARKRAIRAREAAELQASLQPDAGSLATTDAVAPVGKET